MRKRKKYHSIKVDDETWEWAKRNDPEGRDNPASFLREKMNCGIRAHTSGDAPDRPPQKGRPREPSDRRAEPVRTYWLEKQDAKGYEPTKWFFNEHHVHEIRTLQKLGSVRVALCLASKAHLPGRGAVGYVWWEEHLVNNPPYGRNADGSPYWEIDTQGYGELPQL